METLSRSEARRLALRAQGFDRPRPRSVSLAHLRGILRQLGLLQLDYVNVLVPAHYLVPFSRLGPYPRPLLDDLIYRRRELVEQWAHERSVVPVESWPLLRHRREAHRVRPWGFEKFLARCRDYVDRVLDEVRARGPLKPDDLPEPDSASRRDGGARGGWTGARSTTPRMTDAWGWGMAVKNQVLEAHFGFGRLAVAARLPNFARVYDLAARVVPPDHLRRHVTPEEARRELLRLAARALGVATAGDLADYFRMKLGETRPRLAELLDSGELREARVEGWREPAYLWPGARAPRRIEAAALLSPFDPLVWHRPRAARLFEFDYRIEIFVPEPRRRWGYYVLPFLLGERLVARVDLKAERGEGRLVVRAAYLEPHAKPGPVARALAAELWSVARWLGLETLAVERRGGLARPLAAAAAE